MQPSASPRPVLRLLMLVFLFLVAFIAGILAGYGNSGAYRFVTNLFSSAGTAVREMPVLLGSTPIHSIQPARRGGAGVITKHPDDDGGLIFVAGFYDGNNELRLMRRDGTVVARWPVRFSDYFDDTSFIQDRAPPATDWNTDLHGVMALPDGSVVFNFEYNGSVKLDRCNNVMWTLEHQTHHSIYPASAGGYWIPGRVYVERGRPSPFPPFKTPLSADTIMRVSSDGQIRETVSIPQLFLDNGLFALLTATSYWFTDALDQGHETSHINTIIELTEDLAADFPMFEAGDLMLSLRNRNMILVVDPDDWRIKWHKIGPWIRQHDPQFRPGGTIVVFNNNRFWRDMERGGQQYAPDRTSNIIEINPETGEHRVIFGAQEGQEMLTHIRGKVDLTPQGGLLITEFEGGRVIETDAEGNIIWEYINRYDEEFVAEITEARLYPADYFTVDDWSCAGQTANQ